LNRKPNRFIAALEEFSTRVLGPVEPRESLKSISVSTGPGLGGRKPAQRPRGVSGYYLWYQTDGAVFTAVNMLAEFSTGLGYINTMPGVAPSELPETPPEELRLVDELGEVLNLDFMLPNITRNILVAGFCPVEISYKKYPSKCRARIIHPKTVKDIVLDEGDGAMYHGIDHIVQRVNGKTVEISGENLAWFSIYNIANDKRGQSIIKPIESLLRTKQNTLHTIDKLLDRKLAPLIIWKTMRDETSLKEAIANRDEDEDIFLGRLTPEEMESIAQIVEVQGDVKFWEYIEYIDRLIYKSLFAGDLDYWRQTTQASAEVLLDLVERNIAGIQRQVKRSTELGLYKPLIELNGLSTVPRILWNAENPKFRGIQLERFLQTGINTGFIQLQQFYEVLKKSGLDIHMPEKPEPPEKGGDPRDEVL